MRGGAKATLRMYPSSFSEVVGGLEAIFQRPYGCFEQTSSTTYPNVLALDYLRRTRTSSPDVEMKARQYIHLGYQRLVSFEVAGGGFDWFGRPPANRLLTAYGLMEFTDMARMHDVDPGLIERTRRWLLDQQRVDGSWDPEGRMLHENPARSANLARLSTTAYVAWAVFGATPHDPDAATTLDYLTGHAPASIDDPYVLALVANAVAAIDPNSHMLRSYADRLEQQAQTSADGKQVWWASGTGRRTMFFGGGRSASIEATALASFFLIRTGQHPGTARSALTWLVAQKDATGTWHSTQATVLAFKALLAGAGQPLGKEQERRIRVAIDGDAMQEVVIPKDESDVMRQIDLSQLLRRYTPLDANRSFRISGWVPVDVVVPLTGRPQTGRHRTAVGWRHLRQDTARRR